MAPFEACLGSTRRGGRIDARACAKPLERKRRCYPDMGVIANTELKSEEYDARLSYEMVARRAFEISLTTHAGADENWAEAEAQLRAELHRSTVPSD